MGNFITLSNRRIAITVPTGFLAILKAESVINRPNWPEAACFYAIG